LESAQTNSFYFCNSGSAGSPWTSRGQNPTSADTQEVGAVFAVAADTSNLQIIYAGGGRKAGLWKTTDGGANWTNKTDNSFANKKGIEKNIKVNY